MNIKHVWLDFSDTIAGLDVKKHDQLKYQEYARQKKINVTHEMKAEYDLAFEKCGRSNSNVFVTVFGLDASFWPNYLNNHLEIYTLKQPNLPNILDELKNLVKLSVFSNIDTRKVMKNLGIDVDIFENILSSSELKLPKPHVEGYKRLVELSKLMPYEILYIGDDLKKDVIPAKSVGLKVGYMWGECSEADYEFENFESILNLFRVDK